MSDAGTGDAAARRLERAALHDPAAAVAAEARRMRREAPEGDVEEPRAQCTEAESAATLNATERDRELDAEEQATVTDTLDDRRVGPPRPPRRPIAVPMPTTGTVGGRPRKNPLWVRSVVRANDCMSVLNVGESRWLTPGGDLPAYSHFFWYGMSLLPTVHEDNRDAVQQLWEEATVSFEFSSTELLNMPAKLVMPNPVLLPFAGAGLDAIRAALGSDPVIARRLLQRSLFAMPIRDVTIMNRPIELVAQEGWRMVLSTPHAREADVEMILVMFGILMRGHAS